MQEGDAVSVNCVAAKGHAFLPMNPENLWNDTGKIRSSVHRETHPSVTLSYANPLRKWLGLNQGLSSDKQSTNRLSHGKAYYNGACNRHKNNGETV